MAAIYENGQYYIGGGGGALNTLTDVNITNPSDSQVLKYNATSEKWENGTGGGGIDYSTEEQDTGLKWIDGKPVYQKTFTMPKTGSGDRQSISIASLNIDLLLDVKGLWIRTGNKSINITNADVSSSYCTGFYRDNDNLFFTYGSSIASELVSACVTMQYTKTT